MNIDGRVVNFATTHLDYQYEDGRVFEAEQLLAALKDVKGPLILVGDFNDVPAGGAYKLVSEQFGDAWAANRADDPGFSYPADKPAKRIDYIWLSKNKSVVPVKAWVPESDASDHRPLVVEFRLDKSHGNTKTR